MSAPDPDPGMNSRVYGVMPAIFKEIARATHNTKLFKHLERTVKQLGVDWDAHFKQCSDCRKLAQAVNAHLSKFFR